MTATTHSTGRRTAATWVGSTGAFLLLAAAAVFVAHRWDQLPETAKLALVGGLTGAFLVAGRTVRRTLPATGDVLFHLGAFLVPVDLLGACLRAGVGWRVTLLTEGIACVTVFTVLARSTGSVVLDRAAAASVLILAAGIAGVSSVPAGLVLAAIAVAAELARGDRADLRRAAAVWAGVAGLAPVLGAAATAVFRLPVLGVGHGTLAELGLSGPSQQSVALVSGVLAALVLARQAHALRDLRLAFLALASVAVGAGATVTAAGVRGDAQVLGLAGLFVVVEVIALVLFDDDFWGRPLAAVASLAEAVAAAGTVAAGIVLAAAPLVDPLDSTMLGMRPDVTIAATLLLVALGWLVADIRRADPAGVTRLPLALLRGSGWLPGTVGFAVAAATAVEIGTASGLATGVALVAVAAALVAGGRAGAAEVAAVAVPWAVLTAATHPIGAPAIGLAGGVALAVAAGRRGNLLLALDATGTALFASALSEGVLGWAGASYLSAATAWIVALALGSRLGNVARVGLAVPLVMASALPPVDSIGPLLAVAGLFVLDAVRLGRPEVAYGAAAAVQPLVVALAEATGVEEPWAGFALCVCAIVWTGLAAAVDLPWRRPFAAAAGTGLALGLVLAAGDARALSTSLLVAGGVGVAGGTALRRYDLAHLGGVVAVAGLFGTLAQSGVTASEAFVAPVALQLLVAGWGARRRHQASSWIAYTPAVLLLGGAALLERTSGGAGWHALVAGTVGVAAVAAGGWRRLAGPMVAGTALLAVLAVHESLAVVTGVPTWGWLALGGTVLLTTAVLLERTDTSPREAGRRVVEVLAERFE